MSRRPRRRVRYSVAASLDGFIARPGGEVDWILQDAGVDFGAFFAKVDTLVMGRRTYEALAAQDGGADMLSGMALYVVSTTLAPGDVPEGTVSSDPGDLVRALTSEPGKDIWLFGGGVLFRALLEAGLVDRVEVGVMPVLLGEGIPLLPGLDRAASLELHSVEALPTGVVLLKYDVAGS